MNLVRDLSRKPKKRQDIEIVGKAETTPQTVKVRSVGTSFVSTIPARIVRRFPILKKSLLDVTVIEDRIGNLVLIAQISNEKRKEVVRY